jgi:Uma2 family endonuclease
MNVALPETDAPVTLLGFEKRLKDEEFFAFCEANPDLRIERSAEGEIVIVPPPGAESDYQSNDAARQLANWAIDNDRGRAFGSSAQCILPDNSSLVADAAWVSAERLSSVTKEQRRKFLRLAPEFVIEVMSPSDRLKAAQEKMRQWIGNGVQLGWLIHGDRRTVYVFRPNREMEVVEGADRIDGEGPVAGFTVDLRRIWAGL